MMEQVERNKLLNLAREYYNGQDFDKYIEKTLIQKSPMVKYVLDKLVESLKAASPERTYQLGSKEIHTLKRSVFRVLKGLFRFQLIKE